MRGDRACRFLPVEIVPEFGALRLPAGDQSACDHGLAEEKVAHAGACRRVFVDHLRQNVTGAGEGVLDRGNPFFRIDEAGRGRFRISPALVEDLTGQRFQALFPGSHGARSAFGAIGQIHIFENGQGIRPLDGGRQRLGQMAVLLERFQNRRAAFVELPQLVQTVADGGDRHLIQAAGGLFAVPGDKRNGSGLGQKRGHGRHLGRRDVQFVCDQRRVMRIHESPCGPRAGGRCSRGVEASCSLYNRNWGKSSRRHGRPRRGRPESSISELKTMGPDADI